jgi:SAM-dependent methyltransferase
VGKPFLLVSERVWQHFPASLMKTRPVRSYGSLVNSLVRLRGGRKQYHGTYFLRNRPELELIRAIANRQAKGSTLRIAVLACSNGAEVYSIIWMIRSARPDLNVFVHAVDISPEILAIARKGVYTLGENELVYSPIFERITEEEVGAMFEREKEQVRIKSWIRENINWLIGDAGDPDLPKFLGPQDIVVANKFLCHMDPPDAERNLRNIARLVRPGGYLFVSGVDLDVRTKVARALGWTPVPDLLEEIHDGDPSVRRDWPWQYWGLEPFDKQRDDWEIRYAAVFELGSGVDTELLSVRVS